ncbi:MAG: IS110 family transposase [Prolixibacteraceae bacterium]|nr:IS110 family transposase [Prolixibacteraceae bacterium]
MKISEVIGIDVSKLVVDVRIQTTQDYQQFENSANGFKKMCNWVSRSSAISKVETLYVFEHTGMYSYNLAVYLDEHDFCFSIVSGLEIKRSLGIARGKDDKIDATKIARYAYRLRDELKPSILPTKDIAYLRRLLSLRERLVKQRAGFKASFKEQKRVFLKKENQLLFETQEKMIKYISKQIDAVEKELYDAININKELKTLYHLITSINSIGPQTALFMIVFTAAFTKFKDARKFASYCGVAPFPNRSGTSIRGKTKVSQLANKKMKSLLDQCAKNAIQNNYEMKQYYNKRIEQGKSKMSTINVVRNKLLARIFAVIRRQTPYVDLLKYAA